MPYFPHTPEALLGRNDSKHLDKTCKGITSSGRACRRGLASPNARRKSNSSALGGVVALVEEDGEIQEADFYCWQHKDQAEQKVAEEQKIKQGGKPARRRSTELFPLQERSSIDTLVQRLGIDPEVGDGSGNGNRINKTSNPKPPRKTHTNDFAIHSSSQAPYAQKYSSRPSAGQQAKPRKVGFWASLCCVASDEDDYVEVVRHRKRVLQNRLPPMTESRPSGLSSQSVRPAQSSPPAHKPVANLPIRPSLQDPILPASATNHYLSLIPQNVSAQIASALLAEIGKPISPYDEEGYIYIFWLTPQSNNVPPESTARSLLAPDRPHHERRISDVMTEFSYDGCDEAPRSGDRETKKTIMLKIGRANNVTRRMNEWQRQCGYALNLVRWYPYVPSPTTPSPQPSPQRQMPQPLYPDLSRSLSHEPSFSTGRKQLDQRHESDGVRKISCVKRVERLIHLELADKQVKRQCAACGKEHREWFEVDASQAGIKAIDATIRRWVDWAERQHG